MLDGAGSTIYDYDNPRRVGSATAVGLAGYPPVYNLSRATAIQTCQAPGTSLDYIRDYGIVSYDWSNDASVWHADHPNDCDQKMVDQAAISKRAAPQTNIWIYRNLAQAYAEFGQIREKLEDPQYSGWFLKFNHTTNDEKVTPRCSTNSRGKRLCSNLFHWKGQRPNGDCGDIIPCGWYQWDHRNASLRKWIVEEFMMGKKLGMGNESVSGIYIDDWWSPGGPSEVEGLEAGTGLTKGSQEFIDIWTNWSVTTWQAQAAIAAAGGWTWNNFNCMLTKEGGFGGSPVDLNGCGLAKSEGYPRANNTESAPVKGTTISETSVLHKIPLTLSWTRNDGGKSFPLPAPVQDIATHMLVRGKIAYLSYGWIGCTSDYERPAALNYDYGEPVDLICHETTPGSGIFTRRWSKATVTLDCNTFTPNITLDGHSAPIPVPSPPAPQPPPPPAPPPVSCPRSLPNASGYTCTTHTCGYDQHPVTEHCGDDLCYPTVHLPSLCAKLPSPLSAAVAEAKRRCDAYQLCRNFAIDTDDKVFKGSSSFKFFTSGKAGFAPAPDGWHMWLKES